MRTRPRFLAAAAVMISLATSEAAAEQLVVGGYRYASPNGHVYVRSSPRESYVAPRLYNTPQRPDLGAAIAGALAGAALQLIPYATEALIAKLAPADSAPLSTTVPVAAAQPDGSPPSNDVLDDIEGNPRGITRQEVEAALVDWCASHGDAPLCVKLRVNPPRNRIPATPRRPNPIIAAMSLEDADTIGLVDSRPGMDAKTVGLCRTVSASPTGAIS